MQFSKFVPIIFAASIGLVTVSGQETEAQQQRALQILRQKLAEERAATPGADTKAVPAVEPAAPKSPAGKAKEKATEEKASPPPAPVEADTMDQKRALEALRAAMEKDRASQSPPSTSAPTEATPARTADAPSETLPELKETKTTRKPKVTPAKTETKKPKTDETVPAAAPPETTPPGPKTKQERLVNLLRDYRADKVTPQEYHEQRAKILAEP